jgi:hypothetical protein
MFDTAEVPIKEFSKAIVAKHAHNAELARWRIELKALARSERARKKPTPSQIEEAAKLAGSHNPWI